MRRLLFLLFWVLLALALPYSLKAQDHQSSEVAQPMNDITWDF